MSLMKRLKAFRYIVSIVLAIVLILSISLFSVTKASPATGPILSTAETVGIAVFCCVILGLAIGLFISAKKKGKYQ